MHFIFRVSVLSALLFAITQAGDALAREAAITSAHITITNDFDAAPHGYFRYLLVVIAFLTPVFDPMVAIIVLMVYYAVFCHKDDNTQDKERRKNDD